MKILTIDLDMISKYLLNCGFIWNIYG